MAEIAAELCRSKSWVTMRLGLLAEMSSAVRQQLFAGAFPVYSYMYLMRQFMRMNGVQAEQVQDFYPAPLTLAAAMYYTALDPETFQPLYVARTDREKVLQRALLLCHKPEFHRQAREALLAAGRADLIGRGKHCLVPPGKRE